MPRTCVRSYGEVCVRVESPEVPLVLPDDPNAEKQIGDGVGGHGVAEAFLAADEPLEEEAAEDAGEPFAVFEPENDGGDDEWNPTEVPQSDALEIFLDDVAVKKGTVKDFFEGRHYQCRASDAGCDKELRPVRLKLLMRVPWQAGEPQLQEGGIDVEQAQQIIEPNPDGESEEADENAGEAHFPAHFLDPWPHFPNGPRGGDC